MSDGNDGDLRLLAQSEAKPKGTMRGEIADPDVRQRLVIVGLLVLPIQALTHGCIVRDASAVLIDGVTALTFAAHGMRFRLRFLVLSPYETALDTHGPVMVEDNKSPAARDISGVVGQTFGLKSLDLGFKLAETRVDFVGQFLVALMLRRQAVELTLHGIQRGLIFRRQFHLSRIGPAQPVTVGVVEEDM